MRTQARIAWAALAADVLVFVAICKYVDFDALGTFWGTAVMAVPIVGAVGLFAWGMASSITAGIFAKLEDRGQVVASWVVDPDTWRERMAVRLAEGSVGPFDMPDKLPPPEGTEIVVAVDGVFVGRRYVHPLAPGFGALAEVRQGWLDIEFEAEDSHVRLGLATGRDARAQAEAQKVVRRFRAPAGAAWSERPLAGGR